MDISSVTLDMQCFKDNVNCFIITEVSAVDIKTGTILFHHVVSPPYNCSLLSPEKQREASWLTDNFHGLDWYAGDISYTDAIDKIRNILNSPTTILMKGCEKMKYVNSLVAGYCKIIDISTMGCPSLDMLDRIYNSDSVRCNHHKYSHHRCSLSNAINLRKWYLQHNNNEL